MQTVIKRFLGKATDLNLILLSLAAGAFSLQVVFLPPLGQFLATSTAFTAEILLLRYLLTGFDYFSETFNFIHLAVALFLSPSEVFDLTAVFLILSMFVAIGRGSMYLKAFNAHLADTAATFIALPTLRESNPVFRYLIEENGLLLGLFVPKMGLIMAVLYYSYRNLSAEQQVVFVKIATVVGFSMAARNLVLLF